MTHELREAVAPVSPSKCARLADDAGRTHRGDLKPAALSAGAVSHLLKPCFSEWRTHEIGERLAVRRPRMASASETGGLRRDRRVPRRGPSRLADHVEYAKREEEVRRDRSGRGGWL